MTKADEQWHVKPIRFLIEKGRHLPQGYESRLLAAELLAYSKFMPSSYQVNCDPCILVAVVLYKRAPTESESVCSLIRIFESNPELAKHFSLVLFDNSPERHTIELAANSPITYIHRPDNPGLAAAYNFALESAEKHQQKWLLLLDQDTTPNLSFLTELIDCVTSLAGQGDVASIVPKIILGSRTLSPEANFITRLRHPYKRHYGTIRRDLCGIQNGGLVAYNSGATLRVSALRSIGGFPEEFWLDYLDHAVFHALSSKNYRMYVMRGVIEHEPSQARAGDVPEWRQRNLLAAQTLFVMQTGNFLDRLLYRLQLLRDSRGLWNSSPHRRLWKEALARALFLNKPARKPMKP